MAAGTVALGGVTAPAGAARRSGSTGAQSPRSRSRRTGARAELPARSRSAFPSPTRCCCDPDPNDWLIYRRTYDGWGHSPLDQIDQDNVGDLQLAWVWSMGDGRNQPTPLVYDGVMYLANPGNVVQALDAATGTLLWEYRRPLPDALRGANSRNLAIYDDKLYLGARDAFVVALDSRTGELVWETRMADYNDGYSNSSGPIVANGRVVNGINGCSRFMPDSCFITAHDAATGEELWRRLTIAAPGDPGGDTWGDLPLALRGGGDSWIPGSYDPELDLLYWPVAQAKPWVPASRGLTVHDPALYTNSTLALNPADGSIRWYRQHVPGEALDLDEGFEQVLGRERGAQGPPHHRQARHPVEARPRVGGVPRPRRDGVPERVRVDRPRHRRRHLPAGHRRRRHRRLGVGVPRAPPAGTTGTRPVSAPRPGC